MTQKDPQTRRRVLQTMSLSGIAALAGCGGNGDGTGDGDNGGSNGNDTQNLGERVPSPLVLEYWSDIGSFTQIAEDVMPIVQENIQNALDIPVEMKPTETATSLGNIGADKRTMDFYLQIYGLPPSRLDPDEILNFHHIQKSGAQEGLNFSNYASCEYSESVNAQQNASSNSKRQTIVNDALETISNDRISINIVKGTILSLAREDEVNVDGAGEAGLALTNPYVYTRSEPKNQDQITLNIEPWGISTSNFLTISSARPLSIWNQLIHSPLVEYDHNYNLKNVLAKEYEVTDEGTTVRVELEDTTFTNGEPITAEDVQFTYDLLSQGAEEGAYSHAAAPPFESSTIIDERTIEWTLNEPFPILTTKIWPKWGILHKDTWVNAQEDLEGFTWEDPWISSGPFHIRDFEGSQHLILEPTNISPVHDPNYELIIRAYQSSQTAQEAFKSNEIQLFNAVSPGTADQITNQMPDASKVYSTAGFLPYALYPQYPSVPARYQEFRQSIGACIDRQKINEVAFYGNSNIELSSSVFTSTHPWQAPDDKLSFFTDDPPGNSDEARQALLDEGWGWDANDNLRFPDGKDTSPLWPKEGEPSEEDYPCLSAENS